MVKVKVYRFVLGYVNILFVELYMFLLLIMFWNLKLWDVDEGLFRDDNVFV